MMDCIPLGVVRPPVLDELATKEDVVDKEGAYFTTDLQADELSGLGLNYKLIGEDVELSWSTDQEPDNLGYKVQKRAARSPARSTP